MGNKEKNKQTDQKTQLEKEIQKLNNEIDEEIYKLYGITKEDNGGKFEMKEKTFVLIKPDHIDLAEQILHELDVYGNRVKTVKVENIPMEIIESHYSLHKGKFFFKYMVDYFLNKPVVIAIYEGENIIQKFIEFIGPTDPSKAPKETIRGKYSKDSLETAIAEKRTVKNVIHRSDSSEEAIREIDVWKSYFTK